VLKLGAMLIPVMPTDEVVETIVAAEQVGLDYCLLADEGLMSDVYVALGAAALRTSRIRLGPVTNGYTRHPAATATAIATLNELSGGRAIGMLVAGGSMTLAPLGIRRQAPVEMVAESIEVIRSLWSGESITWSGDHVRVDGAQLGTGPQQIPIWVAARGPRMLRLAGRSADGVMLEVKADLESALALVDEGVAGGAQSPDRIYLDRLAYRPDQYQGSASKVFVHVLMDSPDRQLLSLGLSQDEVDAFRTAYRSGRSELAAAYVTDDIVRRRQLMGTPAECSDMLRGLTEQFDLDAFFFYIKSPGLDANTQVMREVLAIVDDARHDR